MIIASGAEMLSIGLTLPFLAALTSPEEIYHHDLMQPFITTTGQINSFIFSKNGHRYEAFIQQDFSQDNNYSSFTSEERKLETSLDINVLGYLIGDDVNQIKPKMVIRENAVEFKMSKERIALQDEIDHANGKLYGL